MFGWYHNPWGPPNIDNMFLHSTLIDGITTPFNALFRQNLKSFFLLLWYSHLYTNLVTPLTSQAGPQYCMKLTKYLVPDMVAETYLKSFTEHEHHVMSSQVFYKDSQKMTALHVIRTSEKELLQNRSPA